MATYDIDELLRRHKEMYRVGYDILNVLGDDPNQWTPTERVVIQCTRFLGITGSGFENFVGNVSISCLFPCLEGLRAVRDNVGTKAIERVVQVFAEYGVVADDRTTWAREADWNVWNGTESTLDEIESRLKEIDDEFIEQIWDDEGPDSLSEALKEYIYNHIEDLRIRKS